MVKVGFSTKDPALRASELAGTGIPYPFVVAYDVLVFEPRDVEQQVHVGLKHCHESKEFFRISVDVAIQTINKVIAEQGKKPLHESQNKRTPEINCSSISNESAGVNCCRWGNCDMSTMKGSTEHRRKHICQSRGCTKPLVPFSKQAHCNDHLCQWITGCDRERGTGIYCNLHQD